MLRPSKEFDDYARAVREAAAAYYKCSPEQVFSHRFGPSTKARHAMMAVMRQTTRTSYPMLGWLYGKHHTAIMNSERVAEPEAIAFILDCLKHMTPPPPWKRIYVTRVKSDKRVKNAGFSVPHWLIQAKCPTCGYFGAGRDDHDPELLFCPRCDHDWYPAKRSKKREVSTASLHAGRGRDSATALPQNGLSHRKADTKPNARFHPPKGADAGHQGGRDVHGLELDAEAGTGPDTGRNPRARREPLSAVD